MSVGLPVPDRIRQLAEELFDVFMGGPDVEEHDETVDEEARTVNALDAKLREHLWDNPDRPDRLQAEAHIAGLRAMLEDIRPSCDCGARGDAVHHVDCPHMHSDWPTVDIKAGEWPMAGT